MADKILIPLSSQIPALGPLSNLGLRPQGGSIADRLGNPFQQEENKEEEKKSDHRVSLQDLLNNQGITGLIRNINNQEHVGRGINRGRIPSDDNIVDRLQRHWLDGTRLEDLPEDQREIQENYNRLRNHSGNQDDRQQDQPMSNNVNDDDAAEENDPLLIRQQQQEDAVQNYLSQLSANELYLTAQGIKAMAQMIINYGKEPIQNNQGGTDYALGDDFWTEQQVQQVKEYEDKADDLRPQCRRYIYFENGKLQSMVVCSDGPVYNESKQEDQ